jgi:putative FmdB family regulatory protein
MPLYEYKAVGKGCPFCKNGFEWIQKFEDKPLDKCPECGGPVVKVVSLFNQSKQKPTKEVLSDKNLARHGFTKLVNEGSGKFRITN